MEQHEIYTRVSEINKEILEWLHEGDIEKTLAKLRERDECMQSGLRTAIEDDLIRRDQVLPILEEIIRQDAEITELLNKKIDNLKSRLTSVSGQRKLRKKYTKKESNDEPRFIDRKG